MAVLDNNTPDPAKIPFLPIALRYGAILGGLSILITLTGLVLDLDPSMPNASITTKIVSFILGTSVSVWAISRAIKEDRDKQLGGFIGLGRCIGLGVLASVASSLIHGLFLALYMTVIDPSYQENVKAQLVEQWETRGMNEEQIEGAMKWTEGFYNPIGIITMSIAVGALFGLIISLIIGLIMKRDPFQ